MKLEHLLRPHAPACFYEGAQGIVNQLHAEGREVLAELQVVRAYHDRDLKQLSELRAFVRGLVYHFDGHTECTELLDMVDKRARALVAQMPMVDELPTLEDKP